MRKKVITSSEAERYNPNIKTGLNDEQVNTRKEQRLVNFTKMIAGKTYWEIIRTDVLTFFNNLLFVIAGFIIFANVADGDPKTPWYQGLFFIFILLSNIIIGLYQDLKAKHLMNKLKVITTGSSRVIRNGAEIEIVPSDIVLDDIIVLKAGEQVPADSIVLEGTIFVDESMLTGESHSIEKKVGDTLYSGSYLTSGSCYARVEKVGKENYIETLTEKAKAFKRNPSHILKSLKVLFRYLGIIIIVIAITTLIIFAVNGDLSTYKSFAQAIRPLAGQLVAMIPAGLYLLTSFALASGVLSLYRKKANVQDFYSIEMLARSDIICVDKTGTITDGNLVVNNTVSLNKESDEEIKNIIATIVNGTKDDNATAKAMLDFTKGSECYDVIKVLPFMSQNKYSGVSTSTGATYLIGALEFMNIDNKDVLSKQSEQYTSKGLRLLTLAKGNEPINGDKYTGKLTAVAFVLLQDHVKESAKQTFKWFQDNNVQVKVISGDNAMTVSEVAIAAGINGAEKFISLEGKSIEEVRNLANDYVVFGRVTPEQKEALIIALRENKHVVAMVGDGINDMLALKRADCSIAMNSGSLSARNVSHVVLMDNDFSTMPSVVAEGRRVINNLQRTGSLFLTKTFFAIAFSVIFLFISIANPAYKYPFSTNNLILWEVFGIGVVAFFIALEPDSKPIKKGFLRHILVNAFPNAIVLLVAGFTCYLLYILHSNGVMYTGVSEFGFNALQTGSPRTGATAMAILVISGLSLVILYNTCRPINLYRGIVVGAASIFAVGFVLLFTFNGGRNPLNIGFDTLSGENWMIIIVLIAVFGALILFVTTMYKFYKKYYRGEKIDEN